MPLPNPFSHLSSLSALASASAEADGIKKLYQRALGNTGGPSQSTRDVYLQYLKNQHVPAGTDLATSYAEKMALAGLDSIGSQAARAAGLSGVGKVLEDIKADTFLGWAKSPEAFNLGLNEKTFLDWLKLPEAFNLGSNEKIFLNWAKSSDTFSAELQRAVFPLAFLTTAELAANMLERETALGMLSGGSENQWMREQGSQAVRELTNAAAQAPTLDDAVKQIFEYIQSVKEPAIQKYIWLVLVPFIFLLLQAVINPIADVYVKKVIGESEQESTKQVKARAVEAVGDVSWLAKHRFVTSKSLKVRSSASAGAPLIGELHFGQTVQVIEKQKDFSLIAWTSADGSVFIRGWVFSRHLKRFG